MLRLGLSTLLFVACHSFRIKHAATSLDKTDASLANPWNVFQKRYGGYHLRPRDFPILYRWKQRKELEGKIKDEDIVAQFFAMQKKLEEEQDFEYLSFKPMTGAEIVHAANLDEVAAKDLKTGIATVVGSPLAIARTLYSLIIWHIPQAEYSSQYADPEGAHPVSDFIKAFRYGSETLGLQGIEARVRKWIEMLHDATSAYYDARGGATETFKEKWSYRIKGDDRRDASKVAIQMWLDNVIHELMVLAGQEGQGLLSEQPGELAEKWIPALSNIYDQITESQLDGDLARMELTKPIDTGEVIEVDEDSGVLNFVYGIFGVSSNEKPADAEPVTEKITNLEEAFEGEYILKEFDSMHGTLEDLRMCFVEIAKQLKSVKQDFKKWKKNSLHGTNTPLKQANVEWAKSDWDDLGIVIPGDVSPQSKRLQDLHDTNAGIITLTRSSLEDLDNSQPGFTYERRHVAHDGAEAEMQHLVIVNVKNFLSGGELVQFMHISKDIGETAVMYMTSKSIPRDSLRPLTFEKVTNIGLYLPALSDVTGLSMETVKDSGTWYKKEMKASLVWMLKKGLQGQLSEEDREATPAQLRDSDNTVWGEIAITPGTGKVFAEMALGIEPKEEEED